MSTFDTVDDTAGGSEFLPLIDVLMVLLVAFMGVTIGLGEIQPPASPKAVPGGGHGATVDVLLDGRLRLDDRPATLDDIRRAWADRKPASVLIRPHQDAAHRHPRAVHALCQEFGIPDAEAARPE